MEYARNFMEYLNQKRNIPFEVHAFSSAEMFLEFAKNNETEILLISDKAMKEEIRRYPIRQIIILSEGVHSPVLDQYPAVYKYQSSEHRLHCCRKRKCASSAFIRRSDGRRRPRLP